MTKTVTTTTEYSIRLTSEQKRHLKLVYFHNRKLINRIETTKTETTYTHRIYFTDPQWPGKEFCKLLRIDFQTDTVKEFSSIPN